MLHVVCFSLSGHRGVLIGVIWGVGCLSFVVECVLFVVNGLLIVV